MARERRQRWWRGLRARVTLVYTIGSLLLVLAVAGASYTLARSQLLNEAEQQYRQRAYVNARDIRVSVQNLADGEEAAQANFDVVNGAILALSRPAGTSQLVRLADGTFVSPSEGLEREPGIQSLTAAIVDLGYNAAEMRVEIADQVSYAVAVRLDRAGTVYYDIRPLAELQDTVNSLRIILLAVAAVASMGGAMLGYWASGRVLKPVSRISSAANAIATGDFSTKLDLQDDRDLALLGNAFNEMVDAVSQRIARERQFTSDVSHELRSPLTTLTASVEVLERRKESMPEVARQAIDLLSQDLTRFERLVEDLLEISRMEAGAVQLQPSRFKLLEFLENVMAQSRSPHLVMSFAPGDPDLAITADKRRLAQVIVNLIDNAEKYGGGATGISYEALGDQVEIVVEDEGPGVPAEDRDRIFERFARMGDVAGNRAVSSGFGLGLSLVAEHIRLHEGSVRVTDRIDGKRGARFVIQLPVGTDPDHMDEFPC